MKITAVRNRLMRVERQNWHFVEVETDEGLVGVGEASVEWRERAVAAAIDELATMLIGEDPNLIEPLLSGREGDVQIPRSTFPSRLICGAPSKRWGYTASSTNTLYFQWHPSEKVES